MLYCNLPDQVTLSGGEVLKPVIGGRLVNVPFLTVEHSVVDVTKSGWVNPWSTVRLAVAFGEENRLIVAEARRRGLKYRLVQVLSRNLRGKRDLHGAAYRPTKWVFVEQKGRDGHENTTVDQISTR